MHIPDIDEPIGLDRLFWTTFSLAEFAFCWFFRPWAWDFPWWHRITGMLLIPFLAALVIYSTTMFAVSLIHHFRSQRQAVALFAMAIVLSGAVIAFGWVMAGFRSPSESAVFLASLVANGLFAYFRRRHPPVTSKGER